MANKSRNKVRIIAGRLRGRMISFPDEPGLRPTGDRLRETLFSWLQPYMPGCCCLDMFAGSGALGFEAVSRGAGQVVMFEKSPGVYANLSQSVSSLGLENAHVERIDATDSNAVSRVVSAGSDGGYDRFNVVFIDPPFAQSLHDSAIDTLVKADVLAENAMICVESSRREELVRVPEHWSLHREKIAGEVRLCLYCCNQQPVS